MAEIIVFALGGAVGVALSYIVNTWKGGKREKNRHRINYGIDAYAKALRERKRNRESAEAYELHGILPRHYNRIR